MRLPCHLNGNTCKKARNSASFRLLPTGDGEYQISHFIHLTPPRVGICRNMSEKIYFFPDHAPETMIHPPREPVNLKSLTATISNFQPDAESLQQFPLPVHQCALVNIPIFGQIKQRRAAGDERG